MPIAVDRAPNADEGSTSCRWKRGIALPPLQSLLAKETSIFFKEVPRSIDLSPIVSDFSSSMITTPKAQSPALPG